MYKTEQNISWCDAIVVYSVILEKIEVFIDPLISQAAADYRLSLLVHIKYNRQKCQTTSAFLINLPTQ